MSSKKHISVEIGIQKADHKSLIQNDIAEALSDLSKDFGVEIDYNYYNLEDKMWISQGDIFDLLDGISDVICITEIYVPKAYRRKHYAADIVHTITSLVSLTGLIFAKASVIKKEYPELKYTTDEKEAKESGKKLVPVSEILSRAEHLFCRNGFFNCSDILNAKEDEKIFLFNSPIGNTTEQFMETALVTYCRMPYRACNKIYTEALYNVSRFEDFDNIHMFPTCVQAKGYDYKTVDTGEMDKNTIDSIKDADWYSGNKDNPSDLAPIATINRETLTKIGGHEVAIMDLKTDINNGPFVYIEVEDDTVHMCTGDGDDLPEAIYYDDEDHDVIRMLGFVLMPDGVWYERVWYFNCDTGVIFDYDNETPLAYVGFFVSTPISEDEDTKNNLLESRRKEIADQKAAAERVTSDVVVDVDDDEDDDDEDEDEED